MCMCVCACVYVCMCVCARARVCVCVYLPIAIHTPHSVLLETVPLELVAHYIVVVDDVTLIARFVPRKVTTYQNSKILYYKNAFHARPTTPRPQPPHKPPPPTATQAPSLQLLHKPPPPPPPLPCSKLRLRAVKMIRFENFTGKSSLTMNYLILIFVYFFSIQRNEYIMFFVQHLRCQPFARKKW